MSVKARQSRVAILASSPEEFLAKARRHYPMGDGRISVEELDKLDWFPGRTIAVTGRDDSAVAYQLN